MTSSTPKPPANLLPFAVKPVQIWRSTDGASRGWFPGIFGTTDRFLTYGYLLPAFAGPSPIDDTRMKLAPSAEACMAAWEQAEPTRLNHAFGLSLDLIEHINELQLFRDPTQSATNAGEQVKEMERVGYE